MWNANTFRLITDLTILYDIAEHDRAKKRDIYTATPGSIPDMTDGRDITTEMCNDLGRRILAWEEALDRRIKRVEATSRFKHGVALLKWTASRSLIGMTGQLTASLTGAATGSRSAVRVAGIAGNILGLALVYENGVEGNASLLAFLGLHALIDAGLRRVAVADATASVHSVFRYADAYTLASISLALSRGLLTADTAVFYQAIGAFAGTKITVSLASLIPCSNELATPRHIISSLLGYYIGSYGGTGTRRLWRRDWITENIEREMRLRLAEDVEIKFADGLYSWSFATGRNETLTLSWQMFGGRFQAECLAIELVGGEAYIECLSDGISLPPLTD
jgi:hypothetical protein